MPQISVVKKTLIYDWRWQIDIDVKVHNLTDLRHCLDALTPDSLLSEEQLDGFVESVALTLAAPPNGYSVVERVLPFSETEKLVIKLEMDKAPLIFDDHANLYVVEMAKNNAGQWVNNETYHANPKAHTDYTMDEFSSVEQVIAYWWPETNSTVTVKNHQGETVWRFTPDDKLGWPWQEILRYNQSHTARGKEEGNA